MRHHLDTTREINHADIERRTTPQDRPNVRQSGGSLSIWFEIIEFYCADSYDERHIIVLPTWATGGCTATLPGEDEYDGTIAVYDLCGTLDYFTDADLPGKFGRATYMSPRAGYCEPRWIVDMICGEPECAT
jgi:hypothetical protein